MKQENHPHYLDMIMEKHPDEIRKELDRLMTKLTDAQKISTPTSDIGRILYR